MEKIPDGITRCVNCQAFFPKSWIGREAKREGGLDWCSHICHAIWTLKIKDLMGKNRLLHIPPER